MKPAILITWAALSLHAAPLPPPTLFVSCNAGAITIDLPGSSSCSLGASFGSTADNSSAASISLSPLLNLSAQVSTPSGVQTGAGALARVTYSFRVNGGSPGDVVPILIAASLSTTSTTGTALGFNDNGFAQVLAQTFNGGLTVFQAACTNGNCGAGPSFSGTLSILAAAGDTNLLQLTVEANAGDGPAEQATAFLDPFVFVDPSFANAGLYSIEVSPGVANDAASVPEPSSARLLAAALAAALLIHKKLSQKGHLLR